MPPAPVTIENIRSLMNELLIEGREHTRSMIDSSVGELRQDIQSFITNNFEPAIQAIDQRFERLEDRVDHLTADITDLRIGMRHVRQALQLKTTTVSRP